MSAIFKGTTLSLVRDELVSDPQYGKGRELEWHGDKAAIFGQFNIVNTQNCRARIAHEGPLYKLTATFQNLQDQEGEEETPVDRWTIRTEGLERDI